MINETNQLKIEQILEEIKKETLSPFGLILIGTIGGEEFRRVFHYSGTTDTEMILELLSSLFIEIITSLYKVENPVELIPFVTGLQGIMGYDLYTRIKESGKCLLPLHPKA